MALKPAARNSFLKQLSKAIENEGIEGIDLSSLSDKELKELYLKWQTVKSGRCYYGVKKGNDFNEDLANGQLQFISFRNPSSYGVRHLTFKEFLLLEDFIQRNPTCRYHNYIRLY